MRRAFLALSALAALTAGSMTVASAEVLHVGPNGVYISPHRHYYDYDRCRTIITHRTNEFGNSVTVRRRVCD